MTNEEIKAKIAELEAQLAENEAETVTLTRKELTEKMAEAFGKWMIENESPRALLLSLTVGASVTENLCESLFEKEV